MFSVLHYIAEVEKERSFSLAARNLHLSQPSLSLTIKGFEQRAGIQLFDRSSTPIRLTEAGAVYIDGIRRILAIESELDAYIDDYNQKKIGSLTLGAAHFMASFLMPTLISSFLKRYPQIHIRIIEGDFLGLHTMVLEGKIDLFLDSNNFDDKLFITTPLFEEHLLLAVPAKYEINRGLTRYRLNIGDIRRDIHLHAATPAVDLTLFRNQPFLILEKGHDLRTRMKHMCREKGFEPKTTLEPNQLATIYSMVDHGLGASVVSDTIVKLSSTGSHIAFYKLDGQQTTRHINMAYKRNRYVTKAMGAFIDLMTDTCTHTLSEIISY